MQNPIYYELFGPDDPAPAPAKPAESPLESDLFDFQSSTGAELLSLELQADELAELMLGGDISKLTQGRSIPRATCQNLEDSMSSYVTKALASAD